MGRQGSLVAQLRVMLWKNRLLKQRNPISSLSELLLPIIVMLGLVGLRAAVSEEDYAAQYGRVQFVSLDDQFSTVFQELRWTLQTRPSVVAFAPSDPLVRELRNHIIDSVWTEFESSGQIDCDLYEVDDDGFDNPICREFASRDELADLFLLFREEADVMRFTKTGDYGRDVDNPQIGLGIVFLSTDPRSPRYRIMLEEGDIPEPDLVLDELQRDLDFSEWQAYLWSGGISLQIFVDNWLISRETGVPTSSAFRQVGFAPFPIAPYTEDVFIDAIEGVFVFWYVLAYLWPVSRLIRAILVEKEARLREILKIMGLRGSVFWLSWFITYFLLFLAHTILLTIMTSASVFRNTSSTVIFTVFFSFGLSIIFFCMLVSTLFSKPKIGSIVGVILFFGGVFPYFAVDDPRAPASDKLAACLISPTALALTLQSIAGYERVGLGLDTSNWGQTRDNFSVAAGVGMMFVNCIVYAVLTWYLDAVIPTDFGTHKVPWFFLQRSYWFGPPAENEQSKPMLSDTEMSRIRDESKFEAVPAELAAKPGIRARQLRKEFDVDVGVHVAVDDLDLDVFEGQIFVLLGHNGAGKSTTMNMLTGMITPTSGDAEIYGRSISTDMAGVRSDLGYCAQVNTIFLQLTVREHLRLIGILKGVPLNEIDAAVTETIEDVGLKEKANTFSGALSGGMKRKLCVGMAFIGGSRVVFLDEPTSGMDPYSRRATWDTLKKLKEGRTIVLTTHFMDEADLLGDRIAIMSKGDISCLGSSLFLKSAYGVGYTFTVSKTDDAKSAEINSFVTDSIDGATISAQAGTEVIFRLPLEASSKFGALFETLDDRKDELGIKTYGISVTTLEEVFLKVGQDVAKESGDHDIAKAKDAAKAIAETLSMSGGDDSGGSGDGGGGDVEQTGGDTKHRSQAEVQRRANRVRFMFPTHVMALFIKRFHHAKRDKRALIFQLLLPVALLALGLFLLKIEVDPSFRSREMDPEMYGNGVNRVGLFSETTGDPASLLDLLDDEAEAVVQGLTFDGISLTPNIVDDRPFTEYAYELLEGQHRAFEDAILDSRFEYSEPRYGSYVVPRNGTAGYAFELLIMYNNVTALHAMPTNWNLLASAYFRDVAGDSSANIATEYQPLPRTAEEKELFAAINGIFSALIITFAFSFVPTSFAVFVVKERLVKAKHQQVISGVSLPAFWISTYAWDIVNFMLPLFAAMIVIEASQTEALTGDNFGPATLGLFAYGLAIVPMTYLLSFLFKSPTSAQIFLIFLYLVAGVAMLMTSFALSQIESQKDLRDDLLIVFRLFPSFCMADILFNLAILNLTDEFFDVDKSPWDMDIVGTNLVYLFVEAVGYLGLCVMVDYLINTPGVVRALWRDPNVPIQAEDTDEDVLAERQRVENADADADDDLIKIKGLRKVYRGRFGAKPKIAVNDLWYGVKNGECFGFLGINGAGKTTTISCLTGDNFPTAGTASIGGYDILTQPLQVRRLIGYCPQFDSLLDSLTAREHLYLYGRIKGVPPNRLGAMVETLIDNLTLRLYADRPAGGYSGGNKRKLSVAIALIGDPVTVFLDEPSTGMDPVARRFMWDLISCTMVGRSVILTTHSMEECEALCQRIGIMVDGRLRCIGSAQHLKSRFGTGYQIEARCPDDKADALVKFIEDTFAGSVLVEAQGGQVTYRVPRDTMPLSKVFATIEENKETLDIAKYAVSGTSLEQIFIGMARVGNPEDAL